MTDYLNVGKIVNTQGIKGEVRVISKTDFPEERYQKGATLLLFQEKKAPMNWSWSPTASIRILTF